MGWFVLAVAPGAWISFGLPLPIPFWARLFTGVMLSPLVVLIQFCALRLGGVSFATTALLLALLNFPAFLLIWRSATPLRWPDRGGWLVALAAIAVSLVSMVESLYFLDTRVYSPHAFVYAEPIYMLSRGHLQLEDPNLAGIRLAYPPWPGLVFQGIQSYLLNSPPFYNFVWWNLLCLILIYCFTAGIAQQFGGGTLARCAAGFWLLWGSNPVGYWGNVLLPSIAKYSVFGDARYTPYSDKFRLFSTMPIGLGCVAALMYLLMRRPALTRPVLMTTALLLTATGLLYPLLFPPACGIVAGKAIALYFERSSEGKRALYKEWMALGIVTGIASLATFGELWFLTADRHSTTPAVLLSQHRAFWRKILTIFIANAPMLAGMLYAWPRYFQPQRGSTIFLLSGAVAAGGLHALFDIPFWANEYKFMSVVFMCLAVFPALAMERIRDTWGKQAGVATLTMISLLVVITQWSEAARLWRDAAVYDTSILDLGAFRAKLRNLDTWPEVCATVDRLTPSDAVLVVDSTDAYFPLFAGRSQYVQSGDKGYDGVMLHIDTLTADIRGNGRAIIEKRRAVLRELYDAADPDRRQRALDQMLSLNRPLALIVEARHAGLQRWIEQSRRGTAVHSGNGWTLWLILRSSNTR
jgi:hypothetical protein